jgi:phage terminase small subunit
MTAKQQRFVDEYLIDLNSTAAAIRAGYSAKSSRSIGAENLTKPYIRARVDTAIAEQSKRTGVNADRVVRELARIAFVDLTDLVDTDTAAVKPDATRDDTAAIAGIRVKTSTSVGGDSVEREVKLCDKLKALELLGRHLGLFNDKLDISGCVPVQIIDDIPDEKY